MEYLNTTSNLITAIIIAAFWTCSTVAFYYRTKYGKQ